MKLFRALFFSSALIMALSACGSSGSGGGGGGSAAGGGQGDAGCVIVAPAESGGGCTITVTTPAHCETIDLTNGKQYQFAWTTSTTECATPHIIKATGNPPTSDWVNGTNLLQAQISSGTRPESGATSNIGGYAYGGAVDFEGLTSTDGIYYIRVCNWYGTSCSESRAFKVLK